MKSLPIDKALRLYQILAPYLPDKVDDSFNFIGTIVDNIKNSGNHRAYIEAVALMMGIFPDMVLQYDPVKDVLLMFAEGLAVNNIMLLKDFCKKVGFNG